MSLREAARRFGKSKSMVAFWVERATGCRLDRVDFSDRKPGRAWNRTANPLEQRIVELRRALREESILGEYGARAIQAALRAETRKARAFGGDR